MDVVKLTAYCVLRSRETQLTRNLLQVILWIRVCMLKITPNSVRPVQLLCLLVITRVFTRTFAINRVAILIISRRGTHTHIYSTGRGEVGGGLYPAARLERAPSGMARHHATHTCTHVFSGTRKFFWKLEH